MTGREPGSPVARRIEHSLKGKVTFRVREVSPGQRFLGSKWHTYRSATQHPGSERAMRWQVLILWLLIMEEGAQGKRPAQPGAGSPLGS